jgi:hypothetical protein
MASHHQTDRPAASGALLPAYRWLATLFAALIVVQAWLGSNGAFQSEEWMVTGHGHLANGMFLLAIIQVVLAWILTNRGVLAMRDVVFNAVLVALTVTQIGLGYSTRDGENWATTVSLHIPNGVLLMGLSTVVAVMAWQVATRTSGVPQPTGGRTAGSRSA